MKRFLFAAAIGFLFSATASADTPPPSTAPAAPVVSSTVPTPMVTNTLTSSPRRMGLFARLRARNTNPMLPTSAAYTAPMMTTTPGSTVPAPMPMTTPTTKPSGVSSATPGVTGAPVMTGSSPTMPMVETMPSTSHRMGLLSRLRMRRTVQ
jgi:hypothetical protein